MVRVYFCFEEEGAPTLSAASRRIDIRSAGEARYRERDAGLGAEPADRTSSAEGMIVASVARASRCSRLSAHTLTVSTNRVLTYVCPL